MRGLILAWVLGEGIIVYRSVTQNHAPPVPGTLIAPSGLFLLLALLAEYQPARLAATALAFGVDVAALLNIWGLGGEQKVTAPQQQKVVPSIPEGSAA
jgi:hypothetical protein